MKGLSAYRDQQNLFRLNQDKVSPYFTLWEDVEGRCGEHPRDANPKDAPFLATIGSGGSWIEEIRRREDELVECVVQRSS